MIFLSVERSPEWVMKPGTFALVETAMGPMPDLKPGLQVKFEELTSFHETTLLPAKRGRRLARGWLDSEKVSKKLGIDEAVLIEFLTSRAEYGLDMVGVSPDGDEPADDDDMHIVPVGDEYMCKLCNKTFKAQGRGGHIRGGQHRKAMKALGEVAKSELNALETSAADSSDDRLAASMKMEEVQRAGA